MPSSRMGLVPSNSAAKEWCAQTGAAAITPRNAARIVSFIFAMVTPLLHLLSYRIILHGGQWRDHGCKPHHCSIHNCLGGTGPAGAGVFAGLRTGADRAGAYGAEKASPAHGRRASRLER